LETESSGDAKKPFTTLLRSKEKWYEKENGRGLRREETCVGLGENGRDLVLPLSRQEKGPTDSKIHE